jgi:hypothetical protein
VTSADALTFPRVKADYLREGLTTVTGFCNSSTATYLSGLEVLQRGLPVEGDVCEIGVHHGKSFLCLALGLPPGQRAVAIDVFENQAANLDKSGRGDREIFEKHLARLGCGEVEILESSSLELARFGFFERGRRFRFFSIDGGHTADVTHNDLKVADQTVVSGGLVVLDDLLNPHWLGVMSGLFNYWAAGGTLVPALLTPNKLILTTSDEHARTYRDLMRAHFREGTTKFNVPIGGGEVDVYGDYPWIITDDHGGTGLLHGATTANIVGRPTTRAVPTKYLEELEKKLDELEKNRAELEERASQLQAAVAAYAHRSARARVTRIVHAVPGGTQLARALRRAGARR